MSDTRLILVDGLPGSGKSTTSEFIAHQAALSGAPVEWITEIERGHPLHAWGDYSGEWLPRTARENASADFMSASIKNIKRFVQSRAEKSDISVVECYPFQSVAGFLRLTGAEEQTVRDHIMAIMGLFEPLKPRLIYLHQSDPVAAMRRTIAQRGEGWGQTLRAINETGLGRQRGFRGDDYISYFAESQALTDRLFDAMTVSKQRIEIDQGDWARHHGVILNFLGLQPAENAFSERLDHFVGQYQDEAGGMEHSVTIDEGHLTLQFHHLRLALLRRSETEFYVSGIRVAFDAGPDGRPIMTVRTKDDLYGKAIKQT